MLAMYYYLMKIFVMFHSNNVCFDDYLFGDGLFGDSAYSGYRAIENTECLHKVHTVPT